MSETEEAVACHYTTGVDPKTAHTRDLKAGDEFHTGGVAATDRLFAQLSVTEGTRVLDVGLGIGGTSRYVADRYGASVTGVDLTPEFVATARPRFLGRSCRENHIPCGKRAGDACA